VEPIEHAALSSLLDSDNAAVSKLITVLSYDCVEIANLRKFVKISIFLLTFSHFFYLYNDLKCKGFDFLSLGIEEFVQAVAALRAPGEPAGGAS